ncbi:PIN domain-containing protein [Zwartia vadi]|uniref:PIN domain-containing protein n=1 Tax=Zwartia vadi TaxID=3058168 RepID=UPI0025B3596F|nr:PIN domain-containing protein [Zwartia vadi]MDN3987008.1 PIN domain-containing protein [Zwartia vadi]
MIDAQHLTVSSSPRPALVLDACIMMSGLLRPLFLQLAQTGLFTPLWTDKIGQEWQRNAARLWPIEPALLKSEWQAMQEQFPASNMGDVTSFETALKHTDRKDKHVAATGIAAFTAAQHGPISVLTWNIKDFSRSELRRQQLGLIDPDRLLSQWWPIHRQTLLDALDKTVNELVSSSRRQPEPMLGILRRDRLFRLAGLYELAQKNPAGI